MAREIKITIEGNQQEEIVLSNSEGKQVVIKDNSTNAKTLFELFDFEPGSKYEIDVQDAGKVKQKVFDEFVLLITPILLRRSTCRCYTVPRLADTCRCGNR